MKSASAWLPLYSSVWWIKALGSSCVEQVYPDSSATASDSESTRRMLRIESCATVPKPYFLNVDTCFFFSPQVSHLVTFTLSCASISMLMTAWECVCVCEWVCGREEGMERRRGAVRKNGREKACLPVKLPLCDRWMAGWGRLFQPADTLRWQVSIPEENRESRGPPHPRPFKVMLFFSWTHKELLCGGELGVQALDEESHCIIKSRG